MTGCEESYGFLPCSTTFGGSISLMVAYGYILLLGANYLSDGSELLLEILNPGLIGGLLLPILGALPDSLVILVSGFGVPKAQAAEQVAVGVGTLAGSTIMLLTVAMGGSLLLGRCDVENGQAVDSKLTKPWDIFSTGVTADGQAKLNAFVMILSCLLFFIVQVPAVLGHSQSPRAALVGCVACLLGLVAYCTYQVVYPELQRRRIERARQRRRRLQAAKLRRDAEEFGTLFDPATGQFDEQVVTKVFNSLDKDHSGYIDEGEIRAFVMGLSLQSTQDEVSEDVDYWMEQLDHSHTGRICKAGFAQGLTKWVTMKNMRPNSSSLGVTVEPAGVDVPLLGKEAEEESVDDEEEKPLSATAIAVRACSMLLLGTLICSIFSDPMVDAVSSFSAASGIPSFFIAFVVTPLASNASELVSSFKFAAKKKKKNISLTLSQVYGAVTMNNTMCLGLFLLVVYVQELTWTFSSEVAVIVGSTVLVGIMGMTRSTYRTYLAFLVLLLYPLTLVLVYVFDFVLKWDG